ncbi:hypothetical protein ABBQ32_014084 [Trebouxia sp. C0010 RCD-2024]
MPSMHLHRDFGMSHIRKQPSCVPHLQHSCKAVSNDCFCVDYFNVDCFNAVVQAPVKLPPAAQLSTAKEPCLLVLPSCLIRLQTAFAPIYKRAEQPVTWPA